MAEESGTQSPAGGTLAKYRAHMMAREEHFRRINEERRAALSEAQARADHTLALLRAERALRIDAEAALSAITTSTSWRATNHLRALLTKMPRVKRTLRATTRALARLVLRRS
jgi:hypothetical protein